MGLLCNGTAVIKLKSQVDGRSQENHQGRLTDGGAGRDAGRRDGEQTGRRQKDGRFTSSCGKFERLPFQEHRTHPNKSKREFYTYGRLNEGIFRKNGPKTRFLKQLGVLFALKWEEE